MTVLNKKVQPSMAAEKCMSSSLMLDQMYVPGGGHSWGPSTDPLTALETNALARALGASMYPNPVLVSTPSSSSRSSTFFPCSPSPTGSTSTFTMATPASSNPGSPFLPSRSASASPRRTRPAACPQPGAVAVVVAAGRVSKRKPRRSTSRRAEISYIEADPAVFREMVQQMTGLETAGTAMPPPQLPVPQHHQPMMSADPQQFLLPPAMPTLDTSAGFVVDTLSVPTQHHQQQILSAPGVLDDFLSYYSEFDELLASTNFLDFPQQQQQQPQPLLPCFPTLESWSN